MELNEISSEFTKINSELDELKKSNEKKFQLIEDKTTKILKAFESSAFNGREVKSVSPAFAISEDKNYENYIHFIRTGEIRNSEEILEFKSKNPSFEGGMPVASSSYSLINSILDDISVLRKICKVQYIYSDTFDVIIEKNGGEAIWGAVNENTATTKRFIRVHELVSQPKATSKLVEDVKMDIDRYMAEKIAESFALAEDKAFLTGTGQEMPYGILKIENGREINQVEQIEGSLNFDSILLLIDKLDSFYSNEVCFLMNKETEQILRSLTDTSGRHIWNNKTSDLSENTILGIPVFTSQHMPSPTSGKQAIIYGNFTKGYKIIEKSGNYMTRDPYTEKPFIKFYTVKKIGGDIIDGRALKVLKIK